MAHGALTLRPVDSVFDESWFLASLDEVGQEAPLPHEEAHHLRKVLRIPAERIIRVTNGTGRVFDCSARDADGGVYVRAEALVERMDGPPPMNMALAMLKGRDLEEPVEGLCQLPLDSIQILVCDHSQVFKGQDHTKLLERLRQKSAVCAKQAKKAWMTRILPPVRFEAWLEGIGSACLIAAQPGPDRLPPKPQSPFHLLVGPEGGFSISELSALSEREAGSLGLGPTRIRATHAPLVAAGKMLGLGWV